MSTSNPAKKVWVIIVTFNGAPWIRDCLHSVVASDYPVKIVVVDNCSTDSTCDIVRKDFPVVLLIQNEHNAGFGAANNIGISQALKEGVDYIFLLNQDTTLTRNTVFNLVTAFENAQTGYGILSPFHLNSEGNNYDAGFLSYLIKDHSRATVDRARENTTISILPVQFVNAAAWMIPSSVLERIGGFAPLFFHYGEDRDFVNRLHYHRLKVGVVSQSFICHFRDDRNMNVSDWSFQRKQKYYFVGWLARSCDVNKSFISGWATGFVWSLKETINDILHSKISTLLVWCNVFFQIVLKAPKILKHRKLVLSNTNLKFLK
jgi:GT2 family glycosyltransferase